MLHSRISNAKLLSYIGFRIPSFNGRNTDLFAVKASKSPIDRTLVLYNKIVREEPMVDIFYMSRKEYSSAINAVLPRLDD